jgi:hypothetical protein
MDVQTVSAIIAGVSAGVAIASAVLAKRSADRSAQAGERSAKAAERSAKASEEAVALDRQRFAHEQAERTGANAPEVDLGRTRQWLWVLAQERTRLVGYVYNKGPGSALIESTTLDGPDRAPVGAELVDEPRRAAADDAFLAESDGMQVAFPWPFGAETPGPLTARVTYRAGDTEIEYRAQTTFTLRRNGSDPNSQPLYRQAEARTRRI